MTRKRVITGIVVLILAIFAFLTWYKIQYSMDVAESFEVNTPDLDLKVLVAT